MQSKDLFHYKDDVFISHVSVPYLSHAYRAAIDWISDTRQDHPYSKLVVYMLFDGGRWFRIRDDETGWTVMQDAGVPAELSFAKL